MPVINPTKVQSAVALTSTEGQVVDERTVQTIQQQYQANHQEEFLHLRAQVEALLIELKTLTISDSDNDSELVL